MSELSRIGQALIERPPIEPPPMAELRRRNEKRHRYNRTAASILGTVALGVALAVVLLPSGTTTTATIRLAGYMAHLPVGYTASQTPEAQCRIYPAAYPEPGHLPAALSTAYAIRPPGTTACLGSWLTANYASASDGTAPIDPVAPPNGTRTTIDGYSAIVADKGQVDLVITGMGNLPSESQFEAESPVGIWVQIPTIGGGYHDLIVGALGLTQEQVLSIVESALPAQPVPAAAGQPPWATIPACAPGTEP